MTKREFSFVQLDVLHFAARWRRKPIQLTPCSPDARGLADDEMQKLARGDQPLREPPHLHYSARSPDRRKAEGHKVRILHHLRRAAVRGTSSAGHSVVSSPTFALPTTRLCSIWKVGKIARSGSSSATASCSARCARSEPQFGRTLCCLTRKSQRFWEFQPLNWTRTFPIQTVSTGMPRFTIVPFRSLATLQKLSTGWCQMALLILRHIAPVPHSSTSSRRETVDPKATLSMPE